MMAAAWAEKYPLGPPTLSLYTVIGRYSSTLKKYVLKNPSAASLKKKTAEEEK